MADDNQAENGAGGKKKLIIIIAAAVLLLGALGGGAYFFFASGDGSEALAAQGRPAQLATPLVEPASYVNIPQPFLYTVSSSGSDRDRLVQIKVQLMVRGQSNENLARHHSPLIESTLLSTFSSATQEQLRSPQGRIELRDQATADIKATLAKVVGEPVIEQVLFTDFVIQ